MKRDKYKVPLITLGLLAVFAVGVHKTHWNDAERERQANHTAMLFAEFQNISPRITTPVEYLPELQARQKYDFREINWGMKVNEVKLIEHRLELVDEGEVDDGDTSHLEYANISLFGLSWDLNYIFEKDSSFAALYRRKNSGKHDYNDVLKALTEVYGPPFGKRVNKAVGDEYWWRIASSVILLGSSGKDETGGTFIMFISRNYSSKP